MRRRDFLVVLGSAAVAWPMAVRAQQAGGIRRVALVHILGKDDKRAQGTFKRFKARMEKLGWIEGKNIHYESYFGGKSASRFSELAKEVVRQTPDVI
jgi:putative ABC transport system substrate-binding protein